MLYRRADVMVYRRADGMVYRSANVMVYRSADVMVYRSADVLEYRRSDVMVYRRADVMVHRRADVHCWICKATGGGHGVRDLLMHVDLAFKKAIHFQEHRSEFVCCVVCFWNVCIDPVLILSCELLLIIFTFRKLFLSVT